MPVMDGLTFAERYREFPEPRAPLILISATVSEIGGAGHRRRDRSP